MGLILRSLSGSAGSPVVGLTGSLYLTGNLGSQAGGGLISLPQISSTSTPANSTGFLYVKASSSTPANSSLWFKDDAGNESDLIGGGTVDGSGTAKMVTYWSDGNTIAASDLVRVSAGGSEIISTGGGLVLSGATGATFGDDTAQLVFNGSGNVDLDAAAMTLDASSLTIGGDGDTGNVVVSSQASGSFGGATGVAIGSSAGNVALQAGLSTRIIGMGVINDAIRLHAGHANGGIDIDCGTGGFDMTSTGAFNVSGADASEIVVSSGATDENLTIAVTGATASSLILASAGTGTDAIDINATAGGIDVDSAGAVNILAGSTADLVATTTLNVVGNGGAAFGDDTATWAFDGSGAVTESGMVSLVVTPSGALTLQGGGASTFGDDTGTIVFNGSGAVSTGGITTVALAASSTFDIDAAGAVTIDGSSITIGADDSGVAISIGHTVSETTVNDNLNVTGNAVIAGDLTVNGTTTTVDTTNLMVKDPFALFGDGAQSANANAGIVFVSGSSAGSARPDVVFGRVANDVWALGSIASNSGSITSATSMTSDVHMRAAAFEVGSAADYLEVDTDLKIVAAADIVLSPAGNNVVPDADAGAALGSAALEWSTVHTNAVASATTLAVGSAGALSLEGSAINIATGTPVAVDLDATTLDIDASGAISLDSSGGAVTLDGGAASSFVCSAGNLTVDSEAATLVLDGHTGVDIDASSSGNVSIDVAAGADILIGGAAVAANVHIGNAITTTAEVELNSVLVDINAGASGVVMDSAAGISLDAAAASNFTTSAGALTLSSAAAATWSTAAGALTLTSAAACTWSTSAGALTLNGTGGIEIQEGGTSMISIDDSRNLLIQSDVNSFKTEETFSPASDNAIDLGTDSLRWRNIYTGDLHLANERGNWTLVEESDMVTFRNNLNGKWYRMAMEEIDPTGRDEGMNGPAPKGSAHSPAGDPDWEI